MNTNNTSTTVESKPLEYEQSLTSVNETPNYPCSAWEPIEGTPFTLIKVETPEIKDHLLTVGDKMVLQQDTKENLMNHVSNMTWELITNLIVTVVAMTIEINKQKETK